MYEWVIRDFRGAFLVRFVQFKSIQGQEETDAVYV